MRYFLQAISKLIVKDVEKNSEVLRAEKDPLIRLCKRVLRKAKSVIAIEDFKARQLADFQTLNECKRALESVCLCEEAVDRLKTAEPCESMNVIWEKVKELG